MLSIVGLSRLVTGSLNLFRGLGLTVLFATFFEDFTNGKLLILVNAAASFVLISTWLSHFDLLKITTFGTAAMLSRYAGDNGRSVLSIAMLCAVLRAIDFAERYVEGFAILCRVPFLSVSCIICFEYWAVDAIIQKQKPAKR